MPTQKEKEQELPRVEYKEAPTEQKELPAELENMTFSVDDFEVEQLPTQGEVGDAEEKPAKKETTPAPSKEVKKPKEEVETEGGGEEVEEVEDKEVEEKKESEKKLPKYLKPPTTTPPKEEKSTLKPIAPPSGKIIRDYSGYSQEQVQAFKQMSDSAYKMTTDLIKQNKDLQGKSTETYLQHPQAYVLDPGFQEVRQQFTLAQKEAAYWEQQLTNMTDNGADVVPIVGWDPQTGAPVTGTPIKASKILEQRLGRKISDCERIGQQLQGKLQEYPTKYKSQIDTDVKGLRDFDQRSFAWEQDPKILDYSIVIEGLGDRSLKQIKEDVKAMVPSWLHNNPLLPTLQNVVIALRLKQAELAEISSSQAAKVVAQEEEERIEPSSKGRATPTKQKGPKINGVTEFKVDPSLGI